jgi:hypothetical protein
MVGTGRGARGGGARYCSRPARHLLICAGRLLILIRYRLLIRRGGMLIRQRLLGSRCLLPGRHQRADYARGNSGPLARHLQQL